MVALVAAGIAILQDVARHTREQVADLHGVGLQGLRILEGAVSRLGLVDAGRAAAPGEYTRS